MAAPNNVQIVSNVATAANSAPLEGEIQNCSQNCLIKGRCRPLEFLVTKLIEFFVFLGKTLNSHSASLNPPRCTNGYRRM